MARKSVTVLFADVTGSTAMGERLDPEALRRLMSRYYEVSRSTLETHGATVEKFIGDAVMAVFGIPAVHEDDALRAARAALELRREVAGLGIELRIGVNTGEVVAEEGETLVTGDAVNVAARLEQAASPGEILVGDTTVRVARHALKVEPLEPITAKGKTEVVLAWRLMGIVEDAQAIGRHMDAPFVGRESELDQLVDAFEKTVATKTAQRVTLLGPPGIGKSRLSLELTQRVAGRARVVAGRCLGYGDGITYWPLTEIVRATGGTERDSILAVAGDDLVADRIAAVIGLGGIAGTKEETQWAARRFLEALAAEAPLVVVIDDLHWAEETFLDLVEYVADFATAPICLLCTARPELLDRRPAWSAPRPNSAAIMLEPLGPQEAALLAGDVTDADRTRILEAAEGNPLFLEQLAAMRVEHDRDFQVPPNLQALLAARIDSLGSAERVVVERASIEGRVFHRGSVVELVPEAVRSDVGSRLLGLVRKGFVRPDRAQLPGDDAYRFAHALVRDAAYRSMSKELRADLHERLVDRLERVAADQLGELEEILAYHLEQAALYRRELDLPDMRDGRGRAAELLVRSGTRAHDRGDMTAAQHLLSRAAELLEPGDRLRGRALLMLSSAVLGSAGGMERALEIVAEALDESRSTGDEATEASAWAMDQLVRVQGSPEADLEIVERDIEARAPAVERLGDVRAIVQLRRLQMDLALTRQVGLKEAAERLLAAARAAGDKANALPAIFFVAAAGGIGPQPVDNALDDVRKLHDLAEGPLEEAAVNHIEGLLRGRRGEFQEGRRLIQEARATYREFGTKAHALTSARDEALIERYAGDATAVERVLRVACDELRASGDTGALSTQIGELADALYELGRDGEADEATRESERLTQHADVESQVVWRRVRAKLLARRGDSDAAARLIRQALDWARTTPSPDRLGDVYRDLAEVERLAGRIDGARAAYERAISAYEQKGLRPMAERTRRDLAALGTHA